MANGLLASFLGRSWITAFAVLVFFPGISVAQLQADGQQLRDQILTGIKTNYERLESVRVTLESTHVNPNIKEETTVTTDLPDGNRNVATQRPRSLQTASVLLSGESLRSDINSNGRGETWALHDGIWTQYIPNMQTAWRRRPDQMPGMLPLDPRDIGAADIRDGLLKQLAGDKLIRAEQIKTADGTALIRCLFERQGGRAAGRRYRCDFDTARNCLPVSVAHLHGDESINVAMGITYQEAIPGSAWFLQRATRRIFADPGVQSAEADGWAGMTTIETKEKPVFNRKVDSNAFEIDLPVGTLIRDSASGSIYRK